MKHYTTVEVEEVKPEANIGNGIGLVLGVLLFIGLVQLSEAVYLYYHALPCRAPVSRTHHHISYDW